jgi:threonine aldolase
MHKIMDFRSDTVTRPTDEMRKVIASAEVGDDIYGDDPSSNALSAYAAEITGKEAALYACSGTMGNLLAFCTAGHQGESIIVGTRAHVWNFEVGGLAAVAGLCPYSVCDDDGIPKSPISNRLSMTEKTYITLRQRCLRSKTRIILPAA